jgi:serine/threonine protein kinase/Tfp pilus assembly protein PilF
MTGQVLGYYRLEAPLGAGGMGTVYRAYDTRLERVVAIKLLNPGTGTADSGSALREARLASALNHPNICAVYEVAEVGDQAFIVMEFVEGRTLNSLIGPRGLPSDDVVRYGAQVADAIAHAHDRGVVHCDLKPQNVIITADGRAKVLDFGIARRMQAAAVDATTAAPETALTPAIAGTLPYMAPEVVRGSRPDVRSDIWSLGVVLHEMATGARPFTANSGYALTAAILESPIPPLPDRVAPAIATAVQRCLVREPGRRCGHAGEIRAVLEASGALTGRTRSDDRPRLPSRRAATLALVGAGGAALAAAIVTRGRLSSLYSGSGAAIQSLAVLPLANLTGDAEQDYFADGMTDALITELAQIAGLRVISRTSIMRYKGARASLPSIARELSVDAVVEGSVKRSNDQVGITVQLIDANSDRHLWAHSYERNLQNVLALHREVAQAIAAEIRPRLSIAGPGTQSSVRAVDPVAYDHCVRGRFFWLQRTEKSLNRAMQHFEQAIERDPTYAPAYSGLADTHFYLGYAFGRVPPVEAMPKARAAAEKALALDPNLAEARTSLGLVTHFYDWDWTGAERELREAIRLNPSYSVAHHGYAVLLMTLGKRDESVAESQRALEVDPLSMPINLILGSMLANAGRFDEAIERYKRTIELSPNFAMAHTDLGSTYKRKGMNAEALDSYLLGLKLDGQPEEWIGQLRRAYATSGWRGYRLLQLQRAKARWDGWHFDAFRIAGLSAEVGDKAGALDWLERAFSLRSGSMVWIPADSAFHLLDAEPRYQQLMKKLNLSPDVVVRRG